MYSIHSSITHTHTHTHTHIYYANRHTQSALHRKICSWYQKTTSGTVCYF